MQKRCFICNKGSIKATSRSHSKVGTIHRQYVNLQRRWWSGVRVLICTRCIKTANKITAKATPVKAEVKK